MLERSEIVDVIKQCQWWLADKLQSLPGNLNVIKMIKWHLMWTLRYGPCAEHSQQVFCSVQEAVILQSLSWGSMFLLCLTCENNIQGKFPSMFLSGLYVTEHKFVIFCFGCLGFFSPSVCSESFLQKQYCYVELDMKYCMYV